MLGPCCLQMFQNVSVFQELRLDECSESFLGFWQCTMVLHRYLVPLFCESQPSVARWGSNVRLICKSAILQSDWSCKISCSSTKPIIGLRPDAHTRVGVALPDYVWPARLNTVPAILLSSAVVFGKSPHYFSCCLAQKPLVSLKTASPPVV